MRVPFVVITGFLGAGKTTLVNRLLARRAERSTTSRIGVIVNELGEIGIDGALLGGDATRQVELPGGCVCCVLGDDLDRTLLELIASNPGLEAIVLETTGVADPLPIAWAVRREPVASAVRLAMVVAVVDATHFLASLHITPAVNAQVAYADALLLTKADSAGPENTAAAIAAATSIAPRAVVRTGTAADHAAWLESVLADPDLEHAPSPLGSDPHYDRDHNHDHGVSALALEISDVIDLEELEDQLAELPANYVRIKGIARTERGWAVFHRVGLRVSSEALEREPDGFGGNHGRMVALGRELRHDQLAACIQAATTTYRSSSP